MDIVTPGFADLVRKHPDDRWRASGRIVTAVFLLGQVAGLILVLSDMLLFAILVTELAFLIFVAYLVQMLELYSSWRQDLLDLVTHQTASAPDHS